MLTLPTNFAQFQLDDDQEAHFIVVLDLVSGWWAFSDTDIGPITDGANSRTIYGLLLEDPDISQEINFKDRTHSISDITIRLDNVTRINDDRVSDLLSNVDQGTVSVYLMKGTRATALSDCLRVFKGKAVKRHGYNATECWIEVENFARFAYPKFPPLISSIEADDPEEGMVVPYVLGDNSEALESDYAFIVKDRHRAARAALPSPPATYFNYRFYCCWGEDATIRAVWLYLPDVEAYALLPSASYTVYTDGTTYPGYTIIELNQSASGIDAYLIVYPNGVDKSRKFTLSQGPTSYPVDINSKAMILDDEDKSWDGDDDTYAVLRFQHAASAGGAGIYNTGAQVCFRFPDLPGNLGRDIDPEHIQLYMKVSKPASGYQYEVGPYATCWLLTWETATSVYADGGSGIFDGTLQSYDMDLSSIVDSSGRNWPIIVGTELGKNDVQLWLRAVVNGADATNEPALNVYDVHLRIKVRLRIENIAPYANVSTPPILYWAGGAPGDRATAATGVYHLLQTALGLVSGTDIDTDSFDAAHLEAVTSPYMYCKGGIDGEEQMDLDELLQELAENANFVVVNDFVGKVRAVLISPPVPGSADIVFEWEDLAEQPECDETRIDECSNIFKYEYGYRRHLGTDRNLDDKRVVREEDSITDLDSEQTATVSLRWADPASVESTLLHQKIANLMAMPHRLVTIRVKGARACHMEMGNWFALDSTTIDQHLKYYGGSWSGHMFMIFGKKVSRDMTILRGIEFTKTYGSV